MHTCTYRCMYLLFIIIGHFKDHILPYCYNAILCFIYFKLINILMDIIYYLASNYYNSEIATYIFLIWKIIDK